MSDIPRFHCEIAWGERTIRTVARLTRRDGEAFPAPASEAGVRATAIDFALEPADEALARLRERRREGAAAATRVGAMLEAAQGERGAMAPARPSYRMERRIGGVVAGVDEAGRGPLAGPVVAAAVVLTGRRFPRGIADSKQLPPEMREALHPKIAAACAVGVGVCSVEEIDSLNILRASLLAMRRALDALPVTPTAALVDGNQPPDFPCPVTCVVEGDALCQSIAAASIVAKVTRDRMMRELALRHAGYGWETNFGYATPEHRAALRRLGPTPLHRRTFAPVRELLQPELFAPMDEAAQA